MLRLSELCFQHFTMASFLNLIFGCVPFDLLNFYFILVCLDYITKQHPLYVKVTWTHDLIVVSPLLSALYHIPQPMIFLLYIFCSINVKYLREKLLTFLQFQAHMKRHLYSHTGIKPHVCRWKCGAIFASYGGRMKHERINHYEENPLQSDCDICGRPFRNQQQLAKHRMTHLNPSERQDYR